MHDAMTDAEQRRLVTEMLAQPAADHPEEGVVAGTRIVRKAAVDQCFAAGILGDEVRRGADALDLALGRQLERAAFGDCGRPRT